MLNTLMNPFRAHVRNGRIILDEPTDLPEGTTLDLVVADSWDELNDLDRKALHADLSLSEQDVRAGRTIDGEEFLAKLKKRG